ncbi:hypothetical protein EDD22DRAFT_947300 [Suillus occidentalis]|nr:hypothetical protein EDD22DRAFT_947300 [Suillus occidentalis]
MVALAVAYPMSGEMMAVAKREEEARGVYFPISYEDKKRGKYSWSSLRGQEALQVFMAVSNTAMLTYLSSRRRGCWRLLPDQLRGQEALQVFKAVAEDEAAGVYFPISYEDKKRAEDEAAGVYFPISYEDKKRGKYSWPRRRGCWRLLSDQLRGQEARQVFIVVTEDEAAGVYFPISYEDKKRSKRGCWRLLPDQLRGQEALQVFIAVTEDEAAGVYFPISYEDKKRAEDEAAGVYFPISYEDKKRGKYSWLSVTRRC